MTLTLSLLVSITITLFLVSKIADYFLAKRPEIKWILFASLGSALIAFTTYIGLTFVIAWLDRSVIDPSLTLTNLHPMAVLVISATIMLLLSSIAFKVINQMCWPSAITTNFVSVAIMTITLAGSFALNGLGSDKHVTAKITPSEKIITTSESVAKLVKP